jgi:hypothetical protein
MTCQELIADRVALLVEVAEIERDVLALEQRGPVPDSDDVHRRLGVVRRTVAAQLLALIDVLIEAQPTVH